MGIKSLAQPAHHPTSTVQVHVVSKDKDYFIVFKLLVTQTSTTNHRRVLIRLLELTTEYKRLGCIGLVCHVRIITNRIGNPII